MITASDLQNTSVFKDFLQEDLLRILPRLSERSFPAGETIIYRGDPGNSMFIILSGNAIATLVNDEGVDYTINTMGPGDNFGEMALISGEPRSANVTSVTEVRLAELLQDAFLELISEYPGLVDKFFQQLAQRRAKSMVREQFSHLERTEIIANILAQPPPALDRFLGASKWTNDINASIERLAQGAANLLILGERGTGKDLAARLIHYKGPGKPRPLFHLDCADPPPIHRESVMSKRAEKDDLLLEIAQESALFGHGADAGSYAKGVRKGYLELADNGTVILTNIDSLSPHVQQLLVQYLKEGTFVRAGESRTMTSATRLISTSSKTRAELSVQGALNPELLPLVSGETLLMKPLRERKKDIPVIAEHLVREYNKKFSCNVNEFTKEALNSLVDHDWPLNIDEMHQVLERAVITAEGGIISERQVFLNVPSVSATGKFNLLKIPFIRELSANPHFPAGMRYVTVPFILALIVLTLVGPEQKNPANLLVWGVWWPFLIFSIIVSARSWCGYCPLPVISDVLTSLRNKYLQVPPSLARRGTWIGVAGFATILLAEHAAHMFSSAHATGVLLICILGSAMTTNFLFGRRSWCKHLCPLGRMVASSSTISVIELGSNSNVCSSQCQTHDCMRDGNCPMGLHPSTAALTKDCILCLSCLKKCKNQSIRINMRLPWYEFITREKWPVIDAFFAVLLAAMVMSVKLPDWPPLAGLLASRELSGPAVTGVIVPVIVVLLFVFATLLSSGFLLSNNWKKTFAICGTAYLFLAFGGFFNVYLHEFVYNGHNFLPWIVEVTGLGKNIPAEWITPNLGTLKAVIPMITIGSAISSLVMLTRLSSTHSLPPLVRMAHQGVILFAAVVFLIVI